jgi:type II secretory pathway pseudopilin PulG
MILTRFTFKSAGFTLLETLISVGIVAVALLTVAGVFISLLSAGSKNSDLETGVLVAQGTLSSVIYNVENNIGYSAAQKTAIFNTPSSTALISAGTVNLDTQPYIYDVTYQTVFTDASHTNNHLSLFEIKMWWASDSSATRQGQGRTSTSLSRLVSEQDNQ